MAEQVDDVTVHMAVAAAIAAAGNAGDGGDGWRKRVMSLIPGATAMITGGRHNELARQVAEAAHFVVVYRGAKLEESSKRLVVDLANRNGEIEQIRTNPSYTPHGASIIRQLNGVEVGSELLVWKAIETMKDRQDRKVRVLVHFEVLRGPQTGQDAAPPAATDQEGDREAPVGDSPVPDEAPSAPSTAIDAVRENLRQLPTQRRKVVLEAFRKKGWATAEDIPAAQHERALYMSLNDGKEPF